MRKGLVRRSIASPFGIAWLDEMPDKGPVRQIANGRKHHPVGNYISAKSRRYLSWESRNELHDLWRTEVSYAVLKSWVQPHALGIVVDGITYSLTPDRLDLMADGRVEIVEVKDAFEADKDPFYAQKLELARAVYAANGWFFRIVERAEIEAQPAFDAIDLIQARRLTAITALDVVDVHNFYAQHESRSWGEVQHLFHGGPRGFATVCALIVHRRLHFDPTGGLTPEAPLLLIRECRSDNA
jgi:hypothetical protein